MANYVKFMRGPLSAYNTLGQKDNDTLYFITDSENNKTILYLGSNLISDSSSNLSQEAQDFLNSLPATNEVNEGDLQVWVGPEETERIDPETNEPVLDPNTGEPVIDIIPGHWDTVSIDELVPVFEGEAPGLVPQAPAQNASGKYLNGEGDWINLDETIIQSAISAIMGEGELDARFDTLKEISDWILNDTSGAAALHSRLVALEEATGVNQTETITQPKVNDEGNPVYVWETQDDGEGGTKPLYWVGLTEEDKTIENTGYPVMINENPQGEEPSYVQELDDSDNPLYWNITEETEKTNIDNGNPVFVQDTEEVEVPIENNDIEILKTTVGDLSELLGYSDKQNGNGKTLTVIDNLDNRLSRVESLISDEGGEISLIVPEVGNLDELLLNTEPTNEGEVESLVEAVNTLDNRTRWQELI